MAIIYDTIMSSSMLLCLVTFPFEAKCRCANGDNATLSEFEEVLKAMNMSSLIPLAPRIFDLFDNNRDGTVDMREILCGFSSLRKSQGDDALRLCFQVSKSLLCF